MLYKEIKQKAAETRAKLTGTKPTSEPTMEDAAAQTNGKKQKTLSNGVGGLGLVDVIKDPSNGESTAAAAAEAAAKGDDDVQMTG